MKRWHKTTERRGFSLGLAAALVSWALSASGAAAQTPPAATEQPAKPEPTQATTGSPVIKDGDVKPASCCGGGLLSNTGGGCASCGGCGGQCYPGRQCCSWCDYDSCCGRIIGGIHDCVCCPDPCYEPCWIAEANAAFFQDGARPVTMTRFRYDGALGIGLPDIAEFFWAKIGGNGPGLANREFKMDRHEFSFYQEIAAKNFSFFVETPYRAVDPTLNEFHSGFGDVNVGTKSLFLDCELIQMAFLFRTYIPSGSAGNGLGTGHVSLEPALLTTIKLCQSTYLQTEFAEWIPLGGDHDYAGALFHYHFSLNHALWRPTRDVALIGTLELNGIMFQEGDFTDHAGIRQAASGHSMVQFGPGLRFALCNRVDFGAGAVFGVAGDSGPEQEYRVDFRVRF